MRRVFVAVAVLAVVVWTCLVGRHALVGRADASDDPLTTEMRKQIDASLIVFVGEITKLGPAPSTKGGLDESRQWVAYRVERFLKGTCFEPGLVVEHIVQNHPNPGGAGLDPVLFAPGRRVVVGVQLFSRDPAVYALQCTSKHLGPVDWTQALEDAAAHFVSISPSVATVRKASPGSLQAKQQRLACMNNLSQLGQCYLIMAQENREKAQKWSGPALWLRMRKNELMIKRGDERVMLCPADPAARDLSSGVDRHAWDDVDLSNPAAGVCSYAGRDFVRCPIDVTDPKKQVIGACLHHAGGAVVVYEAGDVQFLTLEELGLASDDEMSVGPDSKSPVLRVLK